MSVRDVVDNCCADKLADRAAQRAESDADIASSVLAILSLLQLIQRRLVAVLQLVLSLTHRDYVVAPKTARVPLSTRIMYSWHEVVLHSHHGHHWTSHHRHHWNQNHQDNERENALSFAVSHHSELFVHRLF